MEIRRPILKPYDKDKFELVEEYQYKDIIVPASYKTNGANVPRVFWSIFPPNSPEYLSAIVVHDWLCEQAAKLGGADLTFRTPITALTRRAESQSDAFCAEQRFEAFKKADETLREMMIELGCSRLKTWIFYTACRLWHKIKYGA